MNLSAGYLWACFGVLAGAYLLNIFYVSVLYHRGFTHGSIRLRPWFRTWVIHSGSWITGIDPLGWACMHRLHHRHSDTELDPHSPANVGVPGVMLAQLRSYKKALVGLQTERESYVSVVSDLGFGVNWLNRKRVWWLPYLFHAVVALGLAITFDAWLFGASYWVGIMSHPIQGWMVNALGHRFGYRNFDLPDRSKNNTLVAWLVFGEGFQNNHHARPTSATFAVRWFEIDLGYFLARVAEKLRMLDIVRDPIPLEAAAPAAQAAPT